MEILDLAVCAVEALAEARGRVEGGMGGEFLAAEEPGVRGAEDGGDE